MPSQKRLPESTYRCFNVAFPKKQIKDMLKFSRVRKLMDL